MQYPHPYFALDGGSGAHLFAALSRQSPYARQVYTPRHADLLIVAEPISQKLVPAVRETAQTLARPAHVLLVGAPDSGELDHFSGLDLAHVEDIFPNAHRLPSPTVEAVLETVLAPKQWPELALPQQAEPELILIQLPHRQEQEIATELAVLSLGPIQPLTAGPLRLFLICDGEQVFSTQVEAGYAHRGIAEAMRQTDWQQALVLARHLDPLAPIAVQLAYVQVIEHLQQWQPPAPLAALREAAVALERAQNHLWWLLRFAQVLVDTPLTNRIYDLASTLAEQLAGLWQQSPSEWILPQHVIATSMVNDRSANALRLLVYDIDALKRAVARNRLLALRTRGIGTLATDHLKDAGVSGPVLQASEHGSGDVQSRILTRLEKASQDVQAATGALESKERLVAHAANWNVPSGEAHAAVEGPRGMIGLHIESSGGEKPLNVQWQRPSAALLPLLPQVLNGQKLADAEVIIASLDLAMAEADG
jgi:NADH:ubiquinone oxidoreductase subunit D